MTQSPVQEQQPYWPGPMEPEDIDEATTEAAKRLIELHRLAWTTFFRTVSGFWDMKAAEQYAFFISVEQRIVRGEMGYEIEGEPQPGPIDPMTMMPTMMPTKVFIPHRSIMDWLQHLATIEAEEAARLARRYAELILMYRKKATSNGNGAYP